MPAAYFHFFCRYLVHEALRIFLESTGVRHELQKLPGSDGLHVSDHQLELHEPERIGNNASADSSLQERILAKIAAVPVFFVLFASIASAAFAQGSPDLSGIFAGSSVAIVEHMGSPVLQPGQVAECVLSADGHFRLAAMRPRGVLLWTRGSWSAEDFGEAGTDLSFRCDDISGTLTGRREGSELFLKFSPQPLETIAFRMKFRAPVPAAGAGWPETAERLPGTGAGAGMYLGTLFSSRPESRGEPAGSGRALILLGPAGGIAGGVLAPGPGEAAPTAILCPVAGVWRLDGGRIVAKPEWGLPGPPPAWRTMNVQGQFDPTFSVIDGQTSLDGVPGDGCRLERLISWPADGDPAPGRWMVLSCLGSVEQKTTGSPGIERLFPMRISPDRRLIYTRASDDSQTWLAFPLKMETAGEISINADGKCGYITRRDDGSPCAFVLKSSRAYSKKAALLSRVIGPVWIISLDIHRQPLRAQAGGQGDFCRTIAAALATAQDTEPSTRCD